MTTSQWPLNRPEVRKVRGMGSARSTRTPKGRRKLVAELEKELQALAREPLKWLGMPKREDLGSLRERLKTLETRIDELDKAQTSAKSRRRRTA